MDIVHFNDGRGRRIAIDYTGMRQLRLWHWERAQEASCAVLLYEARQHKDPNGYYRQLRERHAAHALHMAAVLQLNNLFDVDDTAEKDASK